MKNDDTYVGSILADMLELKYSGGGPQRVYSTKAGPKTPDGVCTLVRSIMEGDTAPCAMCEKPRPVQNGLRPFNQEKVCDECYEELLMLGEPDAQFPFDRPISEIVMARRRRKVFVVRFAPFKGVSEIIQADRVPEALASLDQQPRKFFRIFLNTIGEIVIAESKKLPPYKLLPTTDNHR